jgi:hypothetical protein
LFVRTKTYRTRSAPHSLHSDRTGGIGFLGESSYAFAPIVFAQSAVLAGVILGRVLYAGERLISFKVTIAILIAFFVLMVLMPLTVFTMKLLSARRRGLRQYGTLGTSYVSAFEEKWAQGGAKGESILGTSDIQSLADLANSYSIVREMHLVPFSLKHVVRLTVIGGMPMAALLLTSMSLEELVDRLIKVIFF